jgi:hypothetical protein
VKFQIYPIFKKGKRKVAFLQGTSNFFPWWERKRNEIKVAEEYCWAISEATVGHSAVDYVPVCWKIEFQLGCLLQKHTIDPYALTCIEPRLGPYLSENRFGLIQAASVLSLGLCRRGC